MSYTSASSDPAPAGQPLESSHEVARANLYHLLAKCFSSPLEMDPKNPAQLRSVMADLGPALQNPGHALAKAWEDAMEDRQALALAYARLFLGPFEILASPYASFYLEPDQRLMSEVSQAVAQTYAACGLAPGPGPREAPDHAAVEWEFMYFLTYQYIDTGDEHWIQQRQQFHSAHLMLWMPSLAAMISQVNEHPFYNALAEMLTSVLEDSETLTGT
jgi:putative dimethyl sulfoxide reductase chaperone